MAQPAPASAAGRVAGAAALIAVLTVASRLAGFGRTAVFTWVLGRTDLGDVYLLANTVPNVVFEIVAGGVLASLVVPLLAGAVARGDRTAVSQTTGALLTWTLAVLIPLAVVVALLAEPIIGLLAGDAPPPRTAAGARMLRVFAAQLPLYGVGIVLTGVLQAHRRFAWPVLAPLLSSVVVIGTYLVFAATRGQNVTVDEAGVGGELILSVGTTLGVVVLSLCLLVPLRRLDVRPRPRLVLAADLRRMTGTLALAGAVTVAVQQVALVVALRLAAGGPVGSVVVFNLAHTVYLLPWAVLAVPLAVAAYPALATAAGAADEAGYRAALAPTVRAVLLLSCLGAAALVATAVPVARFFFGDVDLTTAAWAVAGFGPGLIGYGLFAVLSRALYARAAGAVAAGATAVGWLAVPLVAVGLAWALPTSARVPALALANSAGMAVLGAALLVAVRQRAGAGAVTGVGRAGGVGLLAAGCAAAAGAGVAQWTGGVAAGTPVRVAALVQGMLSGVVVVAVFLAVAWLLDRRDTRALLAAVKRRRRRAGRR